MPCTTVTLPNGVRAIVCGSRRRPPKCGCGSGLPADRLCDWKVPAPADFTVPTRTCDAPICAGCASSPAPGKDLCRTHAEAWKERLAGAKR